jgi:hypothetical protein
MTADLKLMAVPVTPGSMFSAGTSHVVVNTGYLAPQDGRPYDVSPDGTRFLMIKPAPAQERSADELVVIVNALAR